MKKELEKLTFKYLCGLFNEAELHDWMRKEMDQNKNPHLDMYDLNAKDPYEASKILLKISKDKYNFDPYSLVSEDIARKVFVEASEAYLKQKITPSQFCYLITMLDGIYYNSESTYDEKTNIHTPLYGHWWGKLYECCDCCDETWTHADNTHIEKELRKVLKQLK